MTLFEINNLKVRIEDEDEDNIWRLGQYHGFSSKEFVEWLEDFREEHNYRIIPKSKMIEYIKEYFFNGKFSYGDNNNPKVEIY